MFCLPVRPIAPLYGHVLTCYPQCIKNWRGSEGKSADMIEAGTTKTCPMCRTSSRFVTPSSLFYPEGDPMKAQVIEQYKNSMARVKCKCVPVLFTRASGSSLALPGISRTPRKANALAPLARNVSTSTRTKTVPHMCFLMAWSTIWG